MKILFVRINDKIGDTVIETFFYRELKKLFPQSHLTVMCCGNKELLRQIPYIDEFIFLPPGGLGKIIAAFTKTLYIWKQHYDLLISLTPHWRMKFFNAFIRANRKEYFDVIKGAHVSEAYSQVLKRLGKEKIDTTYELPIPNQVQKEVDLFLEKNHLLGKPFLIFNPAGGDPNRTLNQLQVQQIMEQLRGTPVVLLNWQGHYPTTFPEAISWRHASILQTAALVKNAAYILTVDTGIAHIAEVFGKPMTVLFSLKHYQHEPMKDISLLTIWGPRGSQVQKLWAQESVNQIPVAAIVSQLPLPLQ